MNHYSMNHYSMNHPSMNQPNFQAMSLKELHDYFITHRDDREAFYAYADKLHEEGNWIEMPPLESLEDLEKYPEFTERFRGDSQSVKQ